MGVSVKCRTAASEEGSGSGFHEFDAQAFVGDGHLDVVLESLEIVHFPNLLLELVLKLGHVVFGEEKVLGGASYGGSLFAGCAAGISEIASHGLLNGLTGAHQPEDDKERHHGGYEIGVGNLPRAAMMTAVAAFLFEDDDGASFVHGILWRVEGLLGSRFGCRCGFRRGRWVFGAGTVTARRLHFLERWAHVARYRAACHFRRHDGRRAL